MARTGKRKQPATPLQQTPLEIAPAKYLIGENSLPIEGWESYLHTSVGEGGDRRKNVLFKAGIGQMADLPLFHIYDLLVRQLIDRYDASAGAIQADIPVPITAHEIHILTGLPEDGQPVDEGVQQKEIEELQYTNSDIATMLCGVQCWQKDGIPIHKILDDDQRWAAAILSGKVFGRFTARHVEPHWVFVIKEVAGGVRFNWAAWVAKDLCRQCYNSKYDSQAFYRPTLLCALSFQHGKRFVRQDTVDSQAPHLIRYAEYGMGVASAEARQTVDEYIQYLQSSSQGGTLQQQSHILESIKTSFGRVAEFDECEEYSVVRVFGTKWATPHKLPARPSWDEVHTEVAWQIGQHNHSARVRRKVQIQFNFGTPKEELPELSEIWCEAVRQEFNAKSGINEPCNIERRVPQLAIEGFRQKVRSIVQKFGPLLPSDKPARKRQRKGKSAKPEQAGAPESPNAPASLNNAVPPPLQQSTTLVITRQQPQSFSITPKQTEISTMSASFDQGNPSLTVDQVGSDDNSAGRQPADSMVSDSGTPPGSPQNADMARDSYSLTALQLGPCVDSAGALRRGFQKIVPTPQLGSEVNSVDSAVPALLGIRKGEYAPHLGTQSIGSASPSGVLQIATIAGPCTRQESGRRSPLRSQAIEKESGQGSEGNPKGSSPSSKKATSTKSMRRKKPAPQRSPPPSQPRNNAPNMPALQQIPTNNVNPATSATHTTLPTTSSCVAQGPQFNFVYEWGKPKATFDLPSTAITTCQPPASGSPESATGISLQLSATPICNTVAEMEVLKNHESTFLDIGLASISTIGNRLREARSSAAAPIHGPSDIIGYSFHVDSLMSAIKDQLPEPKETDIKKFEGPKEVCIALASLTRAGRKLRFLEEEVDRLTREVHKLTVENEDLTRQRDMAKKKLGPYRQRARALTTERRSWKLKVQSCEKQLIENINKWGSLHRIVTKIVSHTTQWPTLASICQQQNNLDRLQWEQAFKKALDEKNARRPVDESMQHLEEQRLQRKKMEFSLASKTQFMQLLHDHALEADNTWIDIQAARNEIHAKVTSATTSNSKVETLIPLYQQLSALQKQLNHFADRAQAIQDMAAYVEEIPPQPRLQQQGQ